MVSTPQGFLLGFRAYIGPDSLHAAGVASSHAERMSGVEYGGRELAAMFQIAIVFAAMFNNVASATILADKSSSKHAPNQPANIKEPLRGCRILSGRAETFRAFLS